MIFGTDRKYRTNGAKRRRKTLGLLFLSTLLISQTLPLPSSYAAAAVTDPSANPTMLMPMAPRMDEPSSQPSQPPETETAEVPVGTLLLPLTPKLDEGSGHPAFNTTPPSGDDEDKPSPDVATLRKGKATAGELKQLPEVIKPESGDIIDSGRVEDDEGGDEGPLLKGMVQIVADDTEFDEQNNTFLGTGNAVALIGGQDSKLEADTILYNQETQMMDARGNVRIMRNGQLTTGSAFKFKISSDEYLITDPNTDLSGSQVIARWGLGKNGSVDFHDGTVQMPRPFYMAKNAMFAPLGFQDILPEMTKHPDAFVPPQSSWKFKARKIEYERYKDQENLTLFGGKLMFGNFGIPLPKMVTTIGTQGGRMFLPVSVEASSNLQSGGLNIGPAFSNMVGRTGVFTWAPMVQIGGVGLNGVSHGGSIGLSGQVAFTNNFMTAHLAYGSVSNLLVGDFKLRVRKGLSFQSGINRYINDGMFGANRARLRAELVDVHGIGAKIPFISNITFRTSGGWIQDDVQLLNQQSAYKALFGNVNTNSTAMPAAFKVQEQLTVNSQPIFTYGDSHFGIKSYLYGGVAARGYSTGDKNVLGQAGPVMDLYLDRLRLRAGYTESAYQGTSPFIYDSFIQGARSVNLSGGFRVCKYLDLGGSLGYNLVNQLYTAKTISAAIGPDDFKLLLMYNTIQGTSRLGFNVLYGQPVPFDKLVMKGGPDQGQLGGI